MKIDSIVLLSLVVLITMLSHVQSKPAVWAKPPKQPTGTLPHGPVGETIRLGETLVEQTATHPLTKSYVGNALNCTSCHLKNGTDPKAATFIGVATAYPAWSPREQRVITTSRITCRWRRGLVSTMPSRPLESTTMMQPGTAGLIGSKVTQAKKGTGL